MMERLTRRVLQHKRLVAVSWILLTLVGIVAAGPASKALDQRFSVPGREGWEASQEIEQAFGNGGETLPLVPVVALGAGQDRGLAGCPRRAARARGQGAQGRSRLTCGRLRVDGRPRLHLA